jgi:hypothetical protein
MRDPDGDIQRNSRFRPRNRRDGLAESTIISAAYTANSVLHRTIEFFAPINELSLH